MPAVVVEPISVGLQFGFLAVLYLFLLWVARSALRDLRTRRGARCRRRDRRRRPTPPACTRRSRAGAPTGAFEPRLIVERAPVTLPAWSTTSATAR